MPHPRSDKLLLYGLLLVLALLGALAHAAPQFPALTGRVVDDAGVLSQATRRALETTLAQHEADTSNQLVVVTLKDLQGYDIADYGYRLGRHWGIGQAGRDNGALLIVAPNERKVRIEVGYGLEGTLTDAIAHNIIQTIILPKFRQHDFDGGVRAGVDAILAAIAGTYKPLPQKRTGRQGGGDFVPFVILAILLGQFFHGIFRAPLISGGVLGTVTGALVWLVMGSVAFAVLAALLVFLFHLFFMGGGGGGTGRGPWGGGYYGGTYGGGGFSGGGFGGGGGFSGGGGGFGGGGASGGW